MCVSLYLVVTALWLAGPWAKDDTGGYYKAALLSGPPGVGKTTIKKMYVPYRP